MYSGDEMDIAAYFWSNDHCIQTWRTLRHVLKHRCL